MHSEFDCRVHRLVILLRDNEKAVKNSVDLISRVHGNLSDTNHIIQKSHLLKEKNCGARVIRNKYLNI